MQLKYNIKLRLDQLPRERYMRTKQEIANKIKRHPRTLDRYINFTQNDNADIPAADLDIIAIILGCRADELKNYFITSQCEISPLR